MDRLRILLLALGVLLCPASLYSQNAGGEVVVIYNTAVPVSKTIAEHYAKRREVPASQVIGFQLPIRETITRQEFAENLQKPLWEELKKRELWSVRPKSASNEERATIQSSKIRYAVLCYGMPLKVVNDPGLQEEILAKLPVELKRNEASVDSELAVLPGFELNLPLSGFVNNPTYGATNMTFMHPTNGVLMVARLDAALPETAQSLVDKALLAEQKGLWGRAYIDSRGLTNGPHLMGDEWMRAAAEAARLYGFDVTLDTSPNTFQPSKPLPNIALYLGWYDQNVSGPFTNNMSVFVPGAVAYHLHSYSAKSLRTTNEWWAAALIEKGATFTMGCTEEPYLQGTPDVNMFLRRLLFLGASAGEAAYAAQRTLSWQTTMIGDPLYRPFYRTQQEQYSKLEAERDSNLLWSMMMWVNHRLAAGASVDEIEAFYSANPQTKTNAILQERLGEIYKTRGKLSLAVEPFSNALKLPAAPLERLRIGLNGGAVLSSWGRPQDLELAYSVYKELLELHPEYPGKKELYERLAKLAQRMKKPDEAAEFQRLANEG